MTAVSHPFDDGLPLGGPPHAASAWTELEDHAKSEFPHLRDLFADDPSVTSGWALSAPTFGLTSPTKT